MMRVSYYAYPAIAPVVFLGIIQLSTLTPWWNTAGRAPGAEAGVESKQGDAVVVDTGDIRGSWTIADTAATFKVPSTEIKEHYQIPAAVPDSTALKD